MIINKQFVTMLFLLLILNYDSYITIAQTVPLDNDVIVVEWNSNDDRVATGTMNGVISIWDIEEQLEFSFSSDSAPITSLAWHPLREQIATSSYNGVIRVWDISTNEAIVQHEFQIDEDASTLMWLDARRLISGSFFDRNSFLVWDIEQDAEISSFPYGSIPDLDLNMDSSTIAMANPGNMIGILSVDDFRTINIITTLGQPYEVVWSTSGDLIATGNLDGSIELWDIINISEEPEYVFQAGDGSYDGSAIDIVLDVLFVEDDSQLLSITGEGIIRRWDIQTGIMLSEVQLEQVFFDANFNSDGTKLAYPNIPDEGLAIISLTLPQS